MSNEDQPHGDPIEIKRAQESDTPVLDRLRLINGSSAKNFILDQIYTFPISTIGVFGEPARGKTAIVSDLATALRAIGIDVQVTTYDSASGRIIQRLGRDKPEWYPSDYDLLSEHLLQTHLDRQQIPTVGRRINIIELVGIGIKNRGTSTLFQLTDIARAEEKDSSGYLFMGTTSDPAIQSEAGFERKKVAGLPPAEVVPFLARRNLVIEGLDANLSDDEKGEIVKTFYSTTAKNFQIKAVRQEIEKQSTSYNATDLQRLFGILSPQETVVGKKSARRSEAYKRQAAFLLLFLEEQGLLHRSPLQSTEPSSFDKGIVVYNRFIPTIQRRLDLSLFQSRQGNLDLQVNNPTY